VAEKRITLAYNDAGQLSRLSSMTDALARETTYQYDDAGRLIEQISYWQSRCATRACHGYKPMLLVTRAAAGYSEASQTAVGEATLGGQ
jgi:YD repeat-containing protein